MRGGFLVLCWISTVFSAGTTWLAGGSNSSMYRYSAGSWTASATSIDTFNGFAYGNGVWLAAGNSANNTDLLKSTDDGLTWSNVTNATADTAALYCVYYANSKWVIGGVGIPNGIVTSPDTVTWTGQNILSSINVVYAIMYGNSKWVIAGGSTTVGVSLGSTPDNWTFTTMYNVSDFSSAATTTIAYGNSRWIITSYFRYPHGFYTSTDNGATWTFQEYGGSISPSFVSRTVVFAAGKFVIVGGNPTNATSTTIYSTTGDIGTWFDTGYQSPSTTEILGLSYSPSSGLWMSILSNTTANSTDGVAWNGPFAVSFGNMKVIQAKDSFPTGTASPTTKSPTAPPTTAAPTQSPTVSPTLAPTTAAPTLAPTISPTTQNPTLAPTTAAPTVAPTISPTTLNPTLAPTTAAPTVAPTISPTTRNPTAAPTTAAPTLAPTISPTLAPTTVSPTAAPTIVYIITDGDNGEIVNGNAVIDTPVTVSNLTINGTLTIASDLNLTANGTITVSGDIYIASNTQLVLLPPYLLATQMTVLQSDGTITGEFETIVTNDPCINSATEYSPSAVSVVLSTCSSSDSNMVIIIVGVSIGCICIGIAVVLTIVILTRRQRAKLTRQLSTRMRSQEMARVML
jgi:hypothetical protein